MAVQLPAPPSVSPTVGGRPVPDVADLPRMRAERQQRLQEGLGTSGLDGLVLCTTSAVAYATGAALAGVDSGRAALLRTVAAVTAGDPVPHLFTPFPDAAPPELPADHVHPPLYPDLAEEAGTVGRTLAELWPAGSAVGVDDQPPALAAAGRTGGVEQVSAAPVLGPAKLCKTVDELACIRAAQRINERAMDDVRPLVRPGARQCDLSAVFLRRVYELGASTNGIDPIWQPMPATLAEGPWTTHGGVAFPTPSSDRLLREGDVVWVDTGLHVEGYASDFGRTWIASVDPRPSARQEEQFARWFAVMSAVLEGCRPGVAAGDLDRRAVAADAGRRPWIEHFYLAHGVGTDSAEAPLVGTDLGQAFDDALVLEPGMVVVLEPVIWDDGAAGYRSEDIVAITDDGWMPLSDYTYAPYGHG